MRRQKPLRLGPARPIAKVEEKTVYAREVLIAKNLRDAKKDPIGSVVDQLLMRHDELESKDAPNAKAEVAAMISIYGYGQKPGKKVTDSYLKFWLEVKEELNKTLLTERKIVWGSWADP